MSVKNNELAVYVGNKIREFRKSKKMTQKELGEKIGVKHNTVSNYETGIVSPEQDMLFAISRVLGIRVDDLFPSGDSKENFIDRAIEITDTNLSLEDLDFFNELAKHANSLDKDKREKLIKGIKFAVNFVEDNEN
ncbi:helix-turn-helix domain-containing protein [Oceanobacillus kimchii]|uniref:helix-turn-helix domain-containing protein n=1 Tax=Oceanobacillus kimchii TaxID=746691 RepID=UPI0021A3D1A6|nr:helix-turn-helix transcriptional regulator [Oceanobacillus kimchii]MCT1575656.1 helix-turn-helix domain-containing protein [Oceanobacillus kimchii]MCT2137287.1 helix-turn-helix domain-containing protein [Oceanobacillus kimchii]